jgi:hypothetical protein
MKSVHWPGACQTFAALAVTGCLTLAACGSGGSGGNNQHHPAKRSGPGPSATALAEPSSGAAAVAAITANWKTVFNGKKSIPSRLSLVQDGSQLAAFVGAEAKTSFGAAATGSAATVSSVKVTAPSRATVDYEVLLLGTPLLKHQVGTAVYLGGVWKVGVTSFCGLAQLAVSKTGPKLPAVCGG